MAAAPASAARLEAKDIGIVSMDMYFPAAYVQQTALETHDRVSAGKYTIGLGQQGLAFVSDREDIYSITLTAVSQFMAKNKIPYSSIGRLEVATETMLDHSKSIKTVLMQLFAESKNTDVEGVDSYNACYAGTNALFNSVAWMEGSSWDGRYALVVATDIAEYAAGNARPTGGCGAVVMLIGPNAPLVIEPGLRASHFEHAWDFFKPNMTSPYPVVDGVHSNQCYIRSLDNCYNRLAAKVEAKTGTPFDLSAVDYAVFHAPYNKLVQKAFARLLYNDFKRAPTRADFAENKALTAFTSMPAEKSYDDKGLEKAFVDASAKLYTTKAAPSILIPQQIGNTYTASLYAGLLSLVYLKGASLAGARILLYSYGSGLASSMFLIRARAGADGGAAIARIAANADIEARLSRRVLQTPEFFNETMSVREKLHHTSGVFTPSAPAASTPVFAGTYVLSRKDEMGRRFYERVEADTAITAPATAASSSSSSSSSASTVVA